MFNSSLSRYVEPLDVLLLPEQSGKWPKDPAALSRVRLAWLLEVGERLEAAVPGLVSRVREERLVVTRYPAGWPGLLKASHLLSAIPDLALEVSLAMQRQGMLANMITYDALISTCEKGKQAEHALELFQ